MPHAENISYFGDGDEAHMVYQFSLPPLLLDALLQHDARAFDTWLRELQRGGTRHDVLQFHGVTRWHRCATARRTRAGRARGAAWSRRSEQRGGLVGTKRNPDGSDIPYELNITYVDAAE